MIELAGCVILDGSERLLLLHRATAELTQWELPGGKLEPGESPWDTAARELTEELGVTVARLSELGSADFTDRGRPLRYHRFLAAITSGQPRPIEDKFDDVRYFSMSELSARSDLSSNVRNLLSTFSRGFGPAKIS